MSREAKPPFNQAADAQNDNLPQWNFSSFYPGVDSPEYRADVADLVEDCNRFTEDYQGCVRRLDGTELIEAITRYKDIQALADKLFTYAHLRSVQDSKKYGPDFVKVQNEIGPVLSQLVFFGNEIMVLPEKTIRTKLDEAPALKQFMPWLEDLRRSLPHVPPEEVQKYSAELNVASGWIKLYDDHSVRKRYEFEGKKLKQKDILEIFTGDPDRNRRAAAHKAFLDGMKEDAALYTDIHNELMRLKSVDDRWSKFKEPWEARHLSNNIAPEIVDDLEQAVRGSYSRISHRFYALKAKLMGQDTLEIYDRNINVFEGDKQRYIPFDEAKKIVLDAYGRFSPRMAAEMKEFFDKGWIDAAPGENKAGGAFAHPGGAYLANPMIMLNYMGRSRDVMTLAHEGGHGVHQKMGVKNDYIVETPLTLAETASVFGEMLTFKSLLSKAADNDERRKLLFEKVNDMINTVCRQISFYDFEKRIHTAYRAKGGPLTEEEMGAHWVDALQESYGPALPLNQDYGATFGYIPHLIHSPFYVYAYAFGDALVNALYRVYEEGTVPDFVDKYHTMLEKGGTLEAKDLQDMFGLDIADPAFWNKGLKVVEELLDELETLCQPLLQNKAAPPASRPGGPV